MCACCGAQNWVECAILGDDLFEPRPLFQFKPEQIEGDGEATGDSVDDKSFSYDETSPTASGLGFDGRRLDAFGELNRARRGGGAGRAGGARGAASGGRALALGGSAPHLSRAAALEVHSQLRAALGGSTGTSLVDGSGGARRQLSGGEQVDSAGECLSAEVELMQPFIWKPLWEIQKKDVDGVQACIWIFPPLALKACVSVTVHVELELKLTGDLCLPTKSLTAALVPHAQLVIIGAFYVKIPAVVEAGVSAQGPLFNIQVVPELVFALEDGLDVGFNLWLVFPVSRVCAEAYVKTKINFKGFPPSESGTAAQEAHHMRLHTNSTRWTCFEIHSPLPPSPAHALSHSPTLTCAPHPPPLSCSWLQVASRTHFSVETLLRRNFLIPQAAPRGLGVWRR